LAICILSFPEVRHLPIREKLELVDELWLSITPELHTLSVSEEEKKVLDERWGAFLRSPDSALTLEQFQEKMKALRG
jgi:putative addiction module component (TIGR02574 family)